MTIFKEKSELCEVPLNKDRESEGEKERRQQQQNYYWYILHIRSLSVLR